MEGEEGVNLRFLVPGFSQGKVWGGASHGIARDTFKGITNGQLSAIQREENHPRGEREKEATLALENLPSF